MSGLGLIDATVSRQGWQQVQGAERRTLYSLRAPVDIFKLRNAAIEAYRRLGSALAAIVHYVLDILEHRLQPLVNIQAIVIKRNGGLYRPIDHGHKGLFLFFA